MDDAESARALPAVLTAQATDRRLWKDAKMVGPTRKQVVTVRLDADLASLVRQQRGYQTA